MIYLVRHGQTEFNLRGRFQGALDSPLTNLGIEQGRAYAETLRDLAPDAARIITSPQGRARHTAELIVRHCGLDLPIDEDGRLREISVGEWDGRLWPDVARDLGPDPSPGWQFLAPGAESYESITQRLGGWLSDAQALDGVTIAVSHGMSGRILRGLYTGLSREEMLTLDTPQDAVFRFLDGIVQRFDCQPATRAG